MERVSPEDARTEGGLRQPKALSCSASQVRATTLVSQRHPASFSAVFFNSASNFVTRALWLNPQNGQNFTYSGGA